MHIKGLDLNLLHVFQAVYSARNVSRAAHNLDLSQPAVSHALTRLRLLLKDPLFVRAQGGVVPTPRADHFARFVESALSTMEAALSETESFDPARSQRRFRLHLSDIGENEFLPALMHQVRKRAPHVRVETAQLDPAAVLPALEQGRVDLALGYLPQLQGTEEERLWSERYVVVLRKGHPLANRIKKRADLRRLDYIFVRSHTEPGKVLQKLGLEARIRLTIPHFLAIPAILPTTDLALIMPARPAQRFAKQGDIVVIDADIGLPPFPVSIHWYWRYDSDPGNRWLRNLAVSLFKEKDTNKA